MNQCKRTVAEITRELFLRLEHHDFRYAVLRNYERLSVSPGSPADHSMTDIDLVMHRQDVPAWRKLAVALAEDCGWDVLTECGHYAVSRAAEHRIEIFRFFRLSPPACLQVDLFHGYLLLGLPFENEATLLEGRFEDPQFHLTRVSWDTENVYRLLQIHSLLLDGAPEEKIARYRAKVMEHYAANKAEFRLRLRNAFSTFGEKALEALTQSDHAGFRQAMRLGRTWFLVRFCSRHPFSASRYFYERSRDRLERSMRDCCGFVLAAYAPSERDRALLRAALNNLEQEKILPGWTARGSERARISAQERRVMSRGGVAVKWAGSCQHALDVSQAADCAGLVASILPRVIARHPALYVRP